MNKKEIGKTGEKLALDFLLSKNYSILETNYSLPRWGEIDIIALDTSTGRAEGQKELVFVEVRTKTTTDYGDPLESISTKKLHSLRRSINYYLQKDGMKYNKLPMRIDVIGIILDEMTLKIEKFDQVTV